MNNLLLQTEISDDQLHSINLSDCTLSVLINSRELYCSYLDNIHHKVLSVSVFQLGDAKSVNPPWKEALQILNDNFIINKSPGKLRIALDLGGNALIPAELFDEHKLDSYLDFNTLHHDTPKADFIEKINAFNVFHLPEGLLDYVKQGLSFSFYHASTPFIRLLAHENHNTTGELLFGAISGKKVHLAAFKSGRFIFYNGFEANTGEDVSYYLLAVCEELHFHPEEAKVFLSGEIKIDSPLFQTPKRFIRNLNFMDRPKALKYSDRLNSMPHHQYAFLFSIHLCE